jgi:hypothetical protein
MARPKNSWAGNPKIPRCGYPTGGGDPCRWQAGHGTTHKGVGPCKWHEGQNPFTVDRAMRDSREAAEEVERRERLLRRAVEEYGEDSMMVPGTPAHRAWRDLEDARKRSMRLASAAVRFARAQEATP